MFLVKQRETVSKLGRPGFMVGVFVVSLVSLVLLFKKYALLNFDHFLEVCRRIVVGIFGSFIHNIGFLVTMVAIMVVVGFFLKVLFSIVKTNQKINKLIKNKIPVPDEVDKLLELLSIDFNRIYVVDSLDKVALTYGVVYPRIMISTGLINRLTWKQLESVLLHESYHLDKRHPFLLIMAEIVASTIFFIPILKDVAKMMRVEFEKLADEYVVRNQGNSNHLRLALLKTSSVSSKFGIYPSFSVKGIRLIHTYSKKRVILSIFSVVLGLVFLLLPINGHVSVVGQSPVAVQGCGESCISNCQIESFKYIQPLASFSYIPVK